MKSIVIFYSRSGRTKVVAEKISEVLSCDKEEILDYKNRKGIIGWLYAGRDAFKKKLTEIKPISKDLRSYENIIIGTPVWAGNITPAIRTFVKNYYDQFNQVTFFCTMGGSGDKKVFQELEILCNKKPLKKLAIKSFDISSGKYELKIKDCFR